MFHIFIDVFTFVIRLKLDWSSWYLILIRAYICIVCAVSMGMCLCACLGVLYDVCVCVHVL